MRDNQYPGRSVVMSTRGMIATSQPMATQAGLAVLQAGGNAMDAAVAAAGLPLLLAVLALPFGAGAIGMGDLKLLVSVGLLAGAGRMVSGVVWGALLAGVVIVGLLAARRITLRSYIPFGPFLIAGALWAILGVR